MRATLLFLLVLLLLATGCAHGPPRSGAAFEVAPVLEDIDGVKVSIWQTVTRYPFAGDTPEQMRASMALSHPSESEGFDALTRWRIDWSFQTDKTSAPCRVAAAEVQLRLTFVLPQWDHDDRADEATRKRWSYYLEHLVTHEAGHAAHGRQAATELALALIHPRPQASCKALEAAVQASADEIIRAYTALDVRYDADTQHGAAQGAFFP